MKSFGIEVVAVVVLPSRGQGKYSTKIDFGKVEFLTLIVILIYNLIVVSNKRKISAVIFDFWNMLVYDLPDIEDKRAKDRIQRIYKLLKEDDVSLTLNDVAFAYQAVGAMIANASKSDKALTIREQVNFLAEAIRFTSNNERLYKLEDAYCRAHLVYLSPYVPYAKALIEKLFKKYKLGLISNTERASGRYLSMAYRDLLKGFSVTYFSDDRKLRKPNPETFLTTASELAVDPSECLMIGDSEVYDCYGAMNCGMKAILFADPSRGIRSTFVPRVASLESIPSLIENL